MMMSKQQIPSVHSVVMRYRWTVVTPWVLLAVALGCGVAVPATASAGVLLGLALASVPSAAAAYIAVTLLGTRILADNGGIKLRRLWSVQEIPWTSVQRVGWIGQFPRKRPKGGGIARARLTARRFAKGSSALVFESQDGQEVVVDFRMTEIRRFSRMAVRFLSNGQISEELRSLVRDFGGEDSPRGPGRPSAGLPG